MKQLLAVMGAMFLIFALVGLIVNYSIGHREDVRDDRGNTNANQCRCQPEK